MNFEMLQIPNLHGSLIFLVALITHAISSSGLMKNNEMSVRIVENRIKKVLKEII